MSRKLFVNLPVKNLDASVTFFSKLGFSFDAQFTDESATCMIVNDDTAVMLLVEARFKDLTNKELTDASTHTEAIMCISAVSREEVDELVNTAISAGGRSSNDPMDHGWSFRTSTGTSGRSGTWTRAPSRSSSGGSVSAAVGLIQHVRLAVDVAQRRAKRSYRIGMFESPVGRAAI